MCKKNSNEKKVNSLNKEKSYAEKKVNDCRLYFKKLYEDKLKGVITEDDFMMLKEGYSKDVNDAETKLKEIDEELDKLNEKANSAIDIKNILKKYIKIKELNKFIVDEFIEKVYIGKINKENNTREIKIIWNFDL